jgi:hypothetical protein
MSLALLENANGAVKIDKKSEMFLIPPGRFSKPALKHQRWHCVSLLVSKTFVFFVSDEKV